MKKLFQILALSFAGFHLSVAQIVTTLAGSGSAGGTNGTGTAASFNGPAGITAVSGDIYIADRANHRIRKISSTGVVTSFAGSGSPGLVNGTGGAASFWFPSGLCADQYGNIYVADSYNNVVRKITPAGVVTTLAGSTAGFADGPSASAQFNNPVSVIGDNAGNIYVSDQNNQRIRKITSAGTVTTVAGSGAAGFTNGAGTAATFSSPAGIAYDAVNYLYVADQGNNCIRRISSAGVVSTFAGTGTGGATDGATSVATFSNPSGIHIGGSGNSAIFYIADYGNNKIRQIGPGLTVTTMAGSGTAGFLDANGIAAQFNGPADLRYYNTSVYVVDRSNNRVRKIDPCVTPNYPSDLTPVANTTVCIGNSTTLTATGSSGEVINWYATASNTNAVATGTNFIVTSTFTAGVDTFYAEAVNACTVSPRTPIIFTVVCCSVPNTPSNITPAANTTVCAGYATTLTAASNGIISWYAAAAGGTAIATGTTYASPNTLAAGTYTVYAEAVSTCTMSASRTPVVFQVICCAAPNVPFNTTAAANATVCTGNTTTLTATGPGTINWYATASGGAAIATGTNYITPGILPAGNYTIYAEAATSCGVSASRAAVTFTVISDCTTTPTGLNSLQNKISKESIYPNPNKGTFTVELNNNGVKETIEVIDFTGRVLLTKTTADATVNFNLDAFANGIYYVKIQADGNTNVIKVIKQ